MLTVRVACCTVRVACCVCLACSGQHAAMQQKHGTACPHARVPACCILEGSCCCRLHRSRSVCMLHVSCPTQPAVPCCSLHDARSMLPVACCLLDACCMLWLHAACGCCCILHAACFLLHGASCASLFRAACCTELVACCRIARAIRIGSCLLQYPLRTPAGVA